MLGLHFIVPAKWRNIFLLLVSIGFYAWGETVYVILLLVSIVMNCLFGAVLEKNLKVTASKLILCIAITANLGLLGWFKYANFFVDSINSLLSKIAIPAIVLEPLHLPVGLSFFTLQAISYLIDVYRSNGDVRPKPLDVAVYISLFPQLLAGPIIRYRDIAAQICERVILMPDVICGVKRFIVGLGKKVLIANTMGAAADAVFDLPAGQITAGLAWLGAVSYTVQIYFDFSGYSDMAIGLGRILGFHYKENFNYPYLSSSITEFWRRWHISLSTWLRDYLYIPLGGNKRGGMRTYCNLLIVFFLCGLWHGASFTFVAWGLYHGIFLVLERSGRGKAIPQYFKPLQHLYTLLVVMVGWVIFRSESFSQCIAFVRALIGLGAPAWESCYHPALYIDAKYVMMFVFAVSFELFPLLRSCLQMSSKCLHLQTATGRQKICISLFYAVVENVSLAIFLVASILQLAAATNVPFVYFRF